MNNLGLINNKQVFNGYIQKRNNEQKNQQNNQQYCNQCLLKTQYISYLNCEKCLLKGICLNCTITKHRKRMDCDKTILMK